MCECVFAGAQPQCSEAGSGSHSVHSSAEQQVKCLSLLCYALLCGEMGERSSLILAVLLAYFFFPLVDFVGATVCMCARLISMQLFLLPLWLVFHIRGFAGTRMATVLMRMSRVGGHCWPSDGKGAGFTGGGTMTRGFSRALFVFILGLDYDRGSGLGCLLTGQRSYLFL